MNKKPKKPVRIWFLLLNNGDTYIGKKLEDLSKQVENIPGLSYNMLASVSSGRANSTLIRELTYFN